jgi:hypothetical protein
MKQRPSSVKADRFALCERSDTGMAEDEEPELPAQLIAPIISNSGLDQLIADLGTNPLAKGELRQVRQGVYVSLSQSQPENLDFAFCLSSGGRMYFCFRKAAEHST